MLTQPFDDLHFFLCSGPVHIPDLWPPIIHEILLLYNFSAWLCQLVLRFVVSQQSGLQLAALSSGKQLLGGGEALGLSRQKMSLRVKQINFDILMRAFLQDLKQVRIKDKQRYMLNRIVDPGGETLNFSTGLLFVHN